VIENPYIQMAGIFSGLYGIDSEIAYSVMVSNAKELDAGKIDIERFMMKTREKLAIDMDTEKMIQIHDASLQLRSNILALYRMFRGMGFEVDAASNMPEYTWNVLVRKFQIEQEFDHAFLSCRTGFLKPEREFFEYILETRGIAAADCIFIDDSEDNIRAAESTGIDSILFTDAMKLEMDLSERLMS